VEMRAAKPATESQQKPEERKPSDSLPPGAPDGLRKAADGERLGDPSLGPDERPVSAHHEEGEALEYLLGPTNAVAFKVSAQFATAAGDRELEFRFRQLDGERIIEIEEANTEGVGPFARTDDIRLNAALCAEAVYEIRDPSKEGDPDAVIDTRSERFVGGAVTPEDAMRVRFKYQSGLLSYLAERIRSASGWTPGRVGSAERITERAIRNS